jgi:hypothetical protein
MVGNNADSHKAASMKPNWMPALTRHSTLFPEKVGYSLRLVQLLDASNGAPPASAFPRKGGKICLIKIQGFV